MKHEEFSLSGNECALYMYLLMRSNSSGWRNPNEVRNSVAMEILNLNYRDMQSSRDRLQSASLVQFKNQNGSKFLTYSLFDVEEQTFAPIAKVLSKVLQKVPATVYPGVVLKVPENTIVLDKQKLKPKHPNDLAGEVSVKRFNLRGFPQQANAGDYLLQKFDERLQQEFMKNFQGLDQAEMLEKFTEESFMKSYKDEDHMFNTFRKLCRDTAEAKQKPGSKDNSNSIVKKWGG